MAGGDHGDADSVTKAKLNIALDDGASTSTGSDASVFDESHVAAFIRKHVSGATLKESFGAEVTFQLPDDVDSLRCFESLFDDLDRHKNDLRVASYGISDTTLEEVSLY